MTNPETRAPVAQHLETAEEFCRTHEATDLVEVVSALEARDNAVARAARVALIVEIRSRAAELANVTDGRTCPGHCYSEAMREALDGYVSPVASPPEIPGGSKPTRVTVRTKLLELDASNEDKLLRIVLDGDAGDIGRTIAPVLFMDVMLSLELAREGTVK